MDATLYTGSWFSGASSPQKNLFSDEGGLTAYISRGCFTAEGFPSPINSAAEADAAIENGAGLVLRLPVIAVLSGPDVQSFAALTLCDRLRQVSYLAVPVRGLDGLLLEEIALLLFKEPLPYQKKVRALMEEGLLFPEAQAAGVDAFLPGTKRILLDPLNRFAVNMRVAALRRYSRIKLRLVDAIRSGAPESSAPEAGVNEPSGQPPIDPEADKRLGQYLSDFLCAHEGKALQAMAQMTPSCPWIVSEGLLTKREELLRADSFTQATQLLKGGKVTEEQVRRGLLMLLLGIRLPNLSIAGLEAFCPYVRADGITEDEQGKKAWISVLDQSELSVISRSGRLFAGVPLDESRARLASFDTNADRLWTRVMTNG